MRRGALTVRWWSAVTAGALFTTLLVLTGGRGLLLNARETSGLTYFCSGYSGCNSAGYSDSGYGAVSGKMYWRMYPGHNCVNYAAYRMIQAGLSPTRPWTGSGNAANWGHAMSKITDQTPAVGAVAWWDAYHHVGSAGHVAYVEKVISPTDIIISEDSWSGTFHWQEVTASGGFWPSGFIHFKDASTAPVLTNTVAPTITGTSQVGETLTAARGTWTGSPQHYGYYWFADGKKFADHTASVTLTAAQQGKRIRVRVVGHHRNAVPVVATSGATTLVARGVLSPGDAPAVSGDPLVGDTLTGTEGSWTPAPTSYTYQWQADGKPIAGATAATLALTDDLVGKSVRLVARAHQEGYRVGKAISPETKVLAGRITVDSLAVTGTPRPGNTLTAELAATPAAATPTYQWYRSGVSIAGATASTYQVGAADLGHFVSVRVSLTEENYQGASARRAASSWARSLPDLSVDARGTQGGATVRVHVTAPAVQGLDAWIRVRVGGLTRKVRLSDGRAVLDFSGLHRGRHQVRVALHRSPTVEGAVKVTHIRTR